jgi:NDP-hexose 4-ketoreductase
MTATNKKAASSRFDREARRQPILVLGASGFLGTHVCQALRHRPDHPAWVGATRRPPAHCFPGEHWRHLDLVNATLSAYDQLLDEVQPSLIINCAGMTSGAPDALRAINLHVVRKLLTAMERRGGGRLIQMGSAAEYGPQAAHGPVCETATPHPASPYGLTKLMATKLVVAAVEEKRVQGTVLRVFNPVGAGAPETSLAGRAAQAMRRAMAEQRRTISLGSLQVHRDFVAATDVGTATVLAAAAADLPAVLNVGRGVAMSAEALLTLLEGVAGFDGQVIESERGSPRSAWVRWQQADVSLLWKHLGWVPTTPMALAVAALWEAAR